MLYQKLVFIYFSSILLINYHNYLHITTQTLDNEIK